MARDSTTPCRWVTLREALEAFVLNVSGHQGSGHIRALHWYVACRLVLEGGFSPDEITPRPPFVVQKRGGGFLLEHSPDSAGSGERIILGGLKTKAVDVVVTKPRLGPVLAVSMKGTLGAFRNLTNRMEEAVGDCTNLHISYPALVYGFLHALRGTPAQLGVEADDIAVFPDARIAEGIVRYHEVLSRLTGRTDLRNEASRYESVALIMADPVPESIGAVVPLFPSPQSSLHLSRFFEQMYQAYDLRFVYAAPKLEHETARIAWSHESGALRDSRAIEFSPRVSS